MEATIKQRVVLHTRPWREDPQPSTPNLTPQNNLVVRREDGVVEATIVRAALAATAQVRHPPPSLCLCLAIALSSLCLCLSIVYSFCLCLSVVNSPPLWVDLLLLYYSQV